MKLNLLINLSESLKKGPGRRAENLLYGFDRLGVPYDICGTDYEYAVGIQTGEVTPRIDLLPQCTPIGPNVMHCANDIPAIRDRFKNYIVQSPWVADFWKWAGPEIVNSFQFYVWPPSVDADWWKVDRQPKYRCLHYTKYQNQDNFIDAQKLYQSRGHSAKVITYGEYEPEELRQACADAEYCVFDSCCEKGSNVLMEIRATDLPVYVCNSIRWIGDDRFDRCSSAPYFDDRCGIIGDRKGNGWIDFLQGLGTYRPREFVLENYTVEHSALRLIDIVKGCHNGNA